MQVVVGYGVPYTPCTPRTPITELCEPGVRSATDAVSLRRSAAKTFRGSAAQRSWRLRARVRCRGVELTDGREAGADHHHNAGP